MERPNNKEEMEMDELKLSLRTKFMRNIVTKLLSKAIFKKTGYDVNVQINKIEAETCDGKVSIHMDIDAELNSEDLLNILKSVDLI
jgi:hypothetical protein